MREVFPSEFRPTEGDFKHLWARCLFAVDANVLLNLYRYSPDTRVELERSLESVKEQLFITYQAAKEFLKNRLTVTAGQAEEYNKAIREINDLSAKLSSKKRHPFLPDAELSAFLSIVEKMTHQLENQRLALLNRFTNDEILDFVEKAFKNKVGVPLADEVFQAVVTDGESRYQKEIPPGYMDGRKDGSGDPYRKFGDLIVWKQLIAKAKLDKRPIIFITDDKKDDWWLEQSGRTIGPRTELREEFTREASQQFWMYTVDKFMEEAARARNKQVSETAIAEVIDVRKAQKEQRYIPFRTITKEEMLERLADSERWAADKEGFLGLNMFVRHYLGNAGYDYANSYDVIHQLEDEGLLQIYDHKGDGHDRAVTALRLKNSSAIPPPNLAFADLRAAISESNEIVESK